jgi:C-terminal processing protease CtpA/Prc
MKTNAIAAIGLLGLLGLLLAGAPAAHAAKRVGILGGVGATAQGDAGGFRIVSTVPNGPAARAGIRPGDIIQAVDGMPTAALTDADVAELIRGTAGTTVELDVADKQGNRSRRLRLVRVAGALGAPEQVLAPPPAPVAAPPPPPGNPTSEPFRNMEQAIRPRVGGVGVLIAKYRGALRVSKTLPNGPAARAGIQSREIIQAINGAPTATMTDVEAQELVQGQVGTTVELDVSDENGGHSRRLRLVREVLDTAAAAQVAVPGGNLTSVQYQNVQQSIQGTVGGIGALLQKDGGALRVRETVADGPAARAGIRSGTIIQAINGAPTATLTEADAGKLLRGPPRHPGRSRRVGRRGSELVQAAPRPRCRGRGRLLPNARPRHRSPRHHGLHQADPGEREAGAGGARQDECARPRHRPAEHQRLRKRVQPG